MNDYIEMEVAIVEGLEDEVSVLKDQIKILADFLMANFMDDIGPDVVLWTDVVIGIAIRLLTELKEHRRGVLIEGRLVGKLDVCRQQVKALRAERQAMSAECLEEARQLMRFVNHLNKGEPDGKNR